MKYSQVQLQKIRNSLKQALEEEDLNVTERYAFLKNLRIVEDELEILQERLADPATGYDEYQQKAFNLLVECGGEAENLANGGRRIKDMSKVDEDEFEKKIEELNKEYEKTLEKQQKINEGNLTMAKEKVAEVDWYLISRDELSTSKSSVMNENTIHLIKE